MNVNVEREQMSTLFSVLCRCDDYIGELDDIDSRRVYVDMIVGQWVYGMRNSVNALSTVSST